MHASAKRSVNNWNLSYGSEPISRMTSLSLATLIVDALVDAKFVGKSDLDAAVAVATVEIDVRKAMMDYWCSRCATTPR